MTGLVGFLPETLLTLHRNTRAVAIGHINNDDQINDFVCAGIGQGPVHHGARGVSGGTRTAPFNARTLLAGT